MTQTLVTTLATIVVVMIVLWVVSLIRRDASIVDPFWGAGFVLVAWLAWRMNDAESWRAWLLLALVTVWGLRLSLFLWWRNAGHGEDRRYAAMRRHHGKRFRWVSLFTVFLLQAGILWFVSLPIQAALVEDSARELNWLDAIGVALWAIGLFFESAGDWQLARFKANSANANKVMDRGLWRYTRHPNYFGDFCVWWGIYLISAAGGAAWTAASPLLMSVLLMKVSGVALLESTITDRRPEYAAYQARTNAFFPGLPRG
jgi:steroid 5-alpha reductase family enzyme